MKSNILNFWNVVFIRFKMNKFMYVGIQVMNILHVNFVFSLFFHTEDGGDICRRNVC
jgi:hypothetical protein